MKKTLMYVANRIWLILGIYAASLLAGAATFALLEGKSFGDGLWWATVTALTIGYGDLTPVTPAGRVAGIFFGHFWIFMVIPMIIANIILHLVEDQNQFTDEEQKELMQRLRNVEALLNTGPAAARRDDASLGRGDA
ncbi:two pore domain potassium channel family protein [Aquincola sp. S2]|uniref:Two pore domain potassium channel family protein n=1 Tax=Pseudaquabacterium terrae TaxID=2732868 RepID=A0ABX2ETY6_9BURK|nr:potassium channel family protein [Aquabacterium terrae]NRF72118.1 two pore domain potassium channel family protein [Aquabacterium terrae]